MIRYTAGLFTGFEQASDAKDLVRDRGYRDAFVVAYRDGERIPLGEAMREARGEAVLASNGGANTTSNTAVRIATVVRSTVFRNSHPRHSRPVEQRTTGGNTVLERSRTEPTREAPVTAVISAPVVVPTPATSTDGEDPTVKYAATAEAIVSEFVPLRNARATTTRRALRQPVRWRPSPDSSSRCRWVCTASPCHWARSSTSRRSTPNAPRRTRSATQPASSWIWIGHANARMRPWCSGVKDAFVTAYLNGKRIPMHEAAALVAEVRSGHLGEALIWLTLLGWSMRLADVRSFGAS